MESVPDVTNDMNGRTFQGLYLGPTGNLQGTMKYLDLVTGCVKKVEIFTEVPMPYSAIDLVNKWGETVPKRKEIWHDGVPRQVKKRFAWDNDEYDLLEEETPHADIPAEFPGIALDHNDDVEPVSELYEETAEEQIRRVSRTTGVQAHGAGNTGVQGAGNGNTANTDPTTVVVIQANMSTRGYTKKLKNRSVTQRKKKMTILMMKVLLQEFRQHWTTRAILMGNKLGF